MELVDMIREVQSSLGVGVDGRAGPETWRAIHAALVKPAGKGKGRDLEISPVDDRSEKCIGTLQPEVRPMARALVQQAASHGITIRVISGTRSYEEQDALYAKGRSAPGPRVTNARAGFSNHNFGIAFDIGVFSGNRYLAESPSYKAVGALGMQLGLEWGGNWKNITDQPHFQLPPIWATQMGEREMLIALRQRHDAGAPIFA